MKEWAKAESDATSALNIDPSHVKSYHRRSIARSSLGKIRASLQDLHMAKTFAENGSNDLKRIGVEIEKVRMMMSAAIEKAPKKNVPIRMNHPQAIIERNGSNVLPLQKSEKEITQVTEKPLKSSNLMLSSQKINSLHSWLEFEQLWRSLAQPEKVSCLEMMRPQALKSIYRSGIEDCDILFNLVSTCAKIDSGKGYKILQVLSKLPSIDMTVLMMTASEREIAKELIKGLSKTEAAATNILKHFGI